MADLFVQVVSLKIWAQTRFAYGKKLYDLICHHSANWCRLCLDVCGVCGCE